MGDVFKYIIEEANFIEDLSKTRKVRVSNGKKFAVKSGYFKKLKPKGFVLDIASRDYWRLKVGENIKASITCTHFDLKITDAYVRSVGSSITRIKNTHSSKIHIRSFQKKRFSASQKSYYRTVIPIKTNLTFYNIITDE